MAVTKMSTIDPVVILSEIQLQWINVGFLTITFVTHWTALEICLTPHTLYQLTAVVLLTYTNGKRTNH